MEVATTAVTTEGDVTVVAADFRWTLEILDLTSERTRSKSPKPRLRSRSSSTDPLERVDSRRMPRDCFALVEAFDTIALRAAHRAVGARLVATCASLAVGQRLAGLETSEAALWGEG